MPAPHRSTEPTRPHSSPRNAPNVLVDFHAASETSRGMRTVNGETFAADDESPLVEVAPDDDEDLSIVVNDVRCGVVME